MGMSNAEKQHRYRERALRDPDGLLLTRLQVMLSPSADSTLRRICARTGKSPAQVTLLWHMQLGHSTVTRAESPEHQAENLDIFDFELTPEDMAAIATLDWNARCGPDPLFFEWD